MQLQEIRAAVEAIAVAAGDAAMSTFDQPHREQAKANLRDIVTEGDHASEAVILKALRAGWPGFGIISEESGVSDLAGAEYVWHIDPIDGTTNYAAGLPFFCVSIGLSDAQFRPLMGVVYNPFYRELFSAAQGHGATLNGAPIHVSQTDTIERAVLCSGFAVRRADVTHIENLSLWAAFLLRCRDLRRFGSAALELCFVGAGRLDGYWERQLHTWDVMAGLCVAREAGARLSDYAGGEDALYDAREIVASNGLIHDQMLEVLAGTTEAG